MTAEGLAEEICEHLRSVGSIDAVAWDPLDVGVHVGYGVFAKAGVSCTDRNLSALLNDDVRLGQLAENEEFFALPYGEHVLLIFSSD